MRRRGSLCVRWSVVNQQTAASFSAAVTFFQPFFSSCLFSIFVDLNLNSFKNELSKFVVVVVVVVVAAVVAVVVAVAVAVVVVVVVVVVAAAMMMMTTTSRLRRRP